MKLNGFYNMDCMEGMKQIPDKYFDLAIVDPPYGIDNNSSGRLGHYGGKGKTWDSDIPSDEYFIELQRDSNHQIIWGGQLLQTQTNKAFSYLVIS